MKKTALAVLALCLGLLAGCGTGSFAPGGGEVFTPPEANAPASTAESAPEGQPESQLESPLQPEAEPEAGIRLNDELLGLLGKTSAEMREYLPDDKAMSMVTETGFGGLYGRVLGLPRKISFEMKGSEKENIAAADAFYAAGGAFGGGTVPGNVFSDNMRVVIIAMQNEAVQDCLFVPGAELTRTSLNDFFGQVPEMVPGGEFSGMDYGLWECDYEYKGYTIELDYVEDGDDYLPIGAMVWQGSPADIADKLVDLDMDRWL